MITKERTTHTIDAAGKPMGRLASRIAFLLQGKHKPSYMPNLDQGDAVKVANVAEIKFSGKKLEQKVYYRHSGYLGGLKITPVKKVFAADPKQVLIIAVRRMLPKNRLTKERLKRLSFL